VYWWNVAFILIAGACAMFLAFSQKYEDGIFGRVGLLCIAFTAVVTGMYLTTEEGAFRPNATTFSMNAGIMLYLVRQMLQYMRHHRKRTKGAWDGLERRTY